MLLSAYQLSEELIFLSNYFLLITAQETEEQSAAHLILIIE